MPMNYRSYNTHIVMLVDGYHWLLSSSITNSTAASHVRRVAHRGAVVSTLEPVISPSMTGILYKTLYKSIIYIYIVHI